MKKAKVIEGRKCPKCGAVINQINAGYNERGTQRCLCKDCNYKYTLTPKSHEYPEEIQKLAIRMYYSGVSGRGVGKILKMHHANVYRWIKKTERSVDKSRD